MVFLRNARDTIPATSANGDGNSAQPDALDRERLLSLAAEIAAALGQIDCGALAAETRNRIERALHASKRMTSLVADDDATHTGSAPGVPPELPDLIGYRVLLAVHDRAIQLSLGRILDEMGARYEVARDGTAAHTLLAGAEFDLAVIDDALTPGNGREVIAAIRTREGAARKIPVLAICADGAEVAQHALRQSGADAVLASPAPLPFARAIAAIACSARESQPLRDTLSLDSDRFERLLEIAGEDGTPELFDRLLEDLRQVETGLGRALAERNSAEARTQTHVLVALAGAVGADALQRLTESLNAAAHRSAPDEMTALGGQVLRQLSQLIRFIAEQREAHLLLP